MSDIRRRESWRFSAARRRGRSPRAHSSRENPARRLTSISTPNTTNPKRRANCRNGQPLDHFQALKAERPRAPSAWPLLPATSTDRKMLMAELVRAPDVVRLINSGAL
jgi:hypothetical protein